MPVDGDVNEIPDEETFRRKVSNKPSKYQKAVVFFTAVWCPPCRMIKSDFIELAALYKGKEIVFVEVDVDKFRGISNACNVHSLPTFLCYAQGDVVGEIIGPDKRRLGEAVSKLDRLPFERRSPQLEPSRMQTIKVPSVKRAFKKLMHL